MSESRLDRKIARDKILENPEPIWDELREALERTREKLLNAYGYQCTLTANDQNSVIRVARSIPTPGQVSYIEETLEFRFDRQGKRVIVRATERYSRGAVPTDKGEAVVYSITVDDDTLEFAKGQQRFSPVDLAEHEVAERLWGLDLLK